MKNRLLISLMTLICGCTGYQYVPTPHYVPLNKEKGELTANLGYNYLQVGYTITNHFSLFASSRYRNTRDYMNDADLLGGSQGALQDNPDAYRDEYLIFNVGSGFFNHYNKLVLETLIGTGLGKLDYYHNIFNSYGSTRHSFKMHSNTYNIDLQQNIGFIASKYFEIGISAKITKYYDFNIKSENFNFDYNKEVSEDIYFIDKKRADFLYFEPGFTLRAGTNFLKFQNQFVYVFDLGGTPVKRRKFNMYMGVQLNLSKIYPVYAAHNPFKRTEAGRKRRDENKKRKANLKNEALKLNDWM